MATAFSFNLNKSLVISAFLHAAFFVVALFFSVSSVKPLPLGIELAYDSAPTPTKITEHKSRLQVSQALIPSEVTTTKSETVSPATVAQKSAISGREGVANGSEVTPEERYLYELKKLLERRKSYPMMAKKMGHVGTVTMRFTLRADGSLAATEVIEKAPYETLNQAAVSLVQGINGLKPFPNEIHRDSWSITVPIEYKLN